MRICIALFDYCVLHILRYTGDVYVISVPPHLIISIELFKRLLTPDLNLKRSQVSQLMILGVLRDPLHLILIS